MGIERIVTNDNPKVAPVVWKQLQGLLAEAGEAATLRMIDGLPAFPDEEPESQWKELRVGFAHGMVTIRRSDPTTYRIVTWGDIDPQLQVSVERVRQALEAIFRQTR
jgi:hypothetical protein